MEDRERRLHLDTLRATPARLKAALKGVPKAVWLWTPAPGKWSILEIACHLRDMERDAYLARYRRLLAEDEPTLPDVDGDVYALERDYRAQRPAEVLREWTRLRRESLRLLGGLKAAQWSRRGTHETAGPLTVADLLRRHAVGNDEAHLGQIEAIKRRHAVLERLSALPARLGRALRSFSGDAARRPSQPGKWSAVEIACHLRDVDRVYADRITKVAFSERPVFWVMDNDRVAESLRYGEADPAAVIKEARRRREDLVSLLRALPHRAWSRAGLHPKRGELTIEKLASELADHDEHHLKQIEDLPAR
jgi:DinB superfamily